MKFSSDSHWTGGNALRSHLLAPSAPQWIPASSTASSPWARPRRTGIRLGKVSHESTRSVKKASANTCVVSFCSMDKLAKDDPSKASARSRAALRTPPPRLHSLRDNYAEPGYSLEKPPKLSAARTGCLDTCCSETSRVGKSPRRLPRILLS